MSSYGEKKARFNGLLTVYGRNPVAEALQLKNVQPLRLHLAENNKSSKQIDDMIELAKLRGCEVFFHDRMALSRISKNRKQDQGVALDIESSLYQDSEQYLTSIPTTSRLIALDNIHNPQNLGMILRSCAAGFIDGVILPEKGCADISPLTIKASAGALFHCQILRCSSLEKTLQKFKRQGFKISALSLEAENNIYQTELEAKQIFILGNETEGVSKPIMELTDELCFIPMKEPVESLNVAVTAALIAYLPSLIN